MVDARAVSSEIGEFDELSSGDAASCASLLMSCSSLRMMISGELAVFRKYVLEF